MLVTKHSWKGSDMNHLSRNLQCSNMTLKLPQKPVSMFDEYVIKTVSTMLKGLLFLSRHTALCICSKLQFIISMELLASTLEFII